MLLVRALPVDSLALRTLEELLLLIEGELRNLPFRFAPRNSTKKGITEESSGKEILLVRSDELLVDKFSQLEGRDVLCHSDDAILRPFGDQFGISGQDHPTFLAGQLDHLMRI